MKNKTQKLIDIVFEVALTMKENNDWVQNATNGEIVEWVSKQLSSCGYNTIPMGASWGILKK
tara:strand:- start:7436 stop:7621 length:186 start_codon:yes stop_codon:yes gene_type:complete